MAAFLSRSGFKFVVAVTFCFYVLLFFYVVYLFVAKNNDEISATSQGGEFLTLHGTKDHRSPIVPNKPIVVHIWGKAAIGLFLWEHVLEGSLSERDDGLVRFGNLTMGNILFMFSTGPGVVQGLVGTDVEYLILVLNGRDRDKVRFAISWLDYLPELTRCRGVGVLLLGNEACENDWLIPYMKFRGGPVDLVFLIYDSLLVDNYYFYQWPLGVATYRGFPILNPLMVDVKLRRSYKCSFAGTIYQNSSRVELLRILTSTTNPTNCLVRPRFQWAALETSNSQSSYLNMLLDSELTLSPAGINTECYRIYEAMSCGSMPVVEDVPTRGKCSPSSEDGGLLRLLKNHGAPIQYVRNWTTDLPVILQRQSLLPENKKVKQRQLILNWYTQFLKSLRQEFLGIIEKRLVNRFI